MKLLQVYFLMTYIKPYIAIEKEGPSTDEDGFFEKDSFKDKMRIAAI
jgi:hypothetical protein